MTALAELSWPRVAALAGPGALLLVPVGATEQHGPHLPVTTDTDIATAVAERAAARLGGTLVAPAVAYGSSGEHAGFPGTLSIGQEATELLLVELGRSASTDFARTVIVSSHGGNIAPVRRAVARLRDEGRDVRAWGPRWDGDGHAGRTETSVMLAVAPGRVALELAEAGPTRPVAELWDRMAEAGVRSVSRNGVLGDPRGASADEGVRLLDAAVGDLVAFAGSGGPASPGTGGR